jgi:hypothetical protein
MKNSRPLLLRFEFNDYLNEASVHFFWKNDKGKVRDVIYQFGVASSGIGVWIIRLWLKMSAKRNIVEWKSKVNIFGGL